MKFENEWFLKQKIFFIAFKSDKLKNNLWNIKKIQKMKKIFLKIYFYFSWKQLILQLIKKFFYVKNIILHYLFEFFLSFVNNSERNFLKFINFSIERRKIFFLWKQENAIFKQFSS